MGTSFDDGKARGKDQTRLPVPNLPLRHWSSQLFDLRAPSSTDAPVLLVNQPSTYHARTLKFSVHVLGDLIHCFDPFAHFFHSFTQRMRRYSARTGLGSNWERKWVKPENQVTIF